MDNLDNKTYAQLEELLSEKEDEYSNIENDCISKKMNWNEAVGVMRPVAKDIFVIKEQMRLIKEPSFKIGEHPFGKIYTIKSFIQHVNSGDISDSNGHGLYAASNNAISDIPVFVTDIINNKYRKDLNYVLWIKK